MTENAKPPSTFSKGLLEAMRVVINEEVHKHLEEGREVVGYKDGQKVRLKKNSNGNGVVIRFLP